MIQELFSQDLLSFHLSLSFIWLGSPTFVAISLFLSPIRRLLIKSIKTN